MGMSKMRGGNGAGRGYNAHYQGTKVNAFSAQTRNAEPSKDDGSLGSKASYDVKNNAKAPAGATMGQVKKTYKSARKDGFTPDQSRQQAVMSAGPDYTMKTDYKGDAI